VADLQAAQSGKLSMLLGIHAARHLQKLAYGEDCRAVETERAEKSISREYTFLEDCDDRERVRAILLALVDKVGRSLRESGMAASTARIKLRWKDFSTITRQRPLEPPVNDSDTLRESAAGLFAVEKLQQPVRLIGFGVSGLDGRRDRQLSLFDDHSAQREKRERLSGAVDKILAQYGDDGIWRGSALSG
jgi:DNA polymerase-4